MSAVLVERTSLNVTRLETRLSVETLVRHRTITSSSAPVAPPTVATKSTGASVYLAASILTRLEYSAPLFLNSLYAAYCAASALLGLSRSSWTPTKICLTVMDGFHPLSSLRMLRHTLPLGYTFGWKNPVGKATFGGLDG